MVKLTKVQTGQNVTVTFNEQKYTKRIVDKEERQNFILKLSEIQEKLEKTSNNKVIEKLFNTVLNMFTSTSSNIEKNIKNEQIKQKSIKKKLKTLDKSETKEVKKNQAKEKIYNIGVLKKITEEGIKEEYEQLVITNDGIALKEFESIPMPKLLVDKIQEFTKRKVSIQFLINFWYKCLQNPNHVARTKLFDYLLGQNIIITKSGNFVTYRMVKNCNAIGVKLDGYFTDAHTHTMKYWPKSVCLIPRSECDEDGSRDCSKGLHTGNPRFIGINIEKSNKEELGNGYKTVTYSPNEEFGYNEGYGTGYDKPKLKFDESFGNVPIICIVNPANVVSVPDSDTRKMRSCEFYFVKTTTVEEVIALEAGDYLLFDEDYEKIEIDRIKDKIKEQGLEKYIAADSYRSSDITKLRNKLENKLISLKVNDVISPDLSLEQIKTIIKHRLK
jgi:hypothetical protein